MNRPSVRSPAVIGDRREGKPRSRRRRDGGGTVRASAFALRRRRLVPVERSASPPRRAGIDAAEESEVRPRADRREGDYERVDRRNAADRRRRRSRAWHSLRRRRRDRGEGRPKEERAADRYFSPRRRRLLRGGGAGGGEGHRPRRVDDSVAIELGRWMDFEIVIFRSGFFSSSLASK